MMCILHLTLYVNSLEKMNSCFDQQVWLSPLRVFPYDKYTSHVMCMISLKNCLCIFEETIRFPVIIVLYLTEEIICMTPTVL